MFFIVTVTFVTGLVATKLLMNGGLHRLWLRDGIAVCAAYLAFLGMVRLWVWYVCRDGEFDTADVVDATLDSADLMQDSGDFSLGDVRPGDLGDVGFDDLTGCLLLLFLAALFVTGGFLIYAAPAILGEAVFEVLLAAALARRARKLAAGGWSGSVFRATVWIFLAVLAFSVTLGWYAQKSCPEARRIRDAINCVSAARESRLR